jgi:hypothetical protein
MLAQESACLSAAAAAALLRTACTLQDMRF